MTELVFILDRSGSMAGLESDTIGGFNAMLAKQRREPGKALVNTVLFDTDTQVIHDRLPLERVPELTEREYSVRGCTALLDAIGGAIHHIGNIHKYSRPEDRPERTVVVIVTDGLENASHRYSYARVQQMIAHEQAKYGWEFLFLGANMDAVREAGRLGIRPDRAARYHADREGTAAVYDTVGDAITCVRETACVPDGWAEPVRRDYEGREK